VPSERRFACTHSLPRSQDSLGKKINKKVMGMFEKAEQEYQDVMAKKRIVENDKRKIELVIEELDEKKNQALKTTWTKVQADLS
jgi:structural maintenance of chromosome 2